MLFAFLDLWDFLAIIIVASIFSGGVAAYFRPADRLRLVRLERKLDLVLKHLGLEYVPGGEPWQQIADDPSRKIEAIKAYREQTGVGLAEAKRAVEDYTERGIQGV